jgi:hypothetical protein
LQAQAAGEVRLEGALVAPLAAPRASGKAKFESRRGRRKFSTQVEDTAAGATLTVLVSRPGGGTAVLGQIRTDAVGRGDLNLDTALGQTVPVLQTGDIVQVLSSNGLLVVSGVLAPK